jgi:hypothetical protein
MTTLEMGPTQIKEFTPEQRMPVLPGEYIREAGVLLAELDEKQHGIVYGIDDRQTVADVASDIGWLAANAYGYVPFPITCCRTGASQENVGRIFKYMDDHVRINGDKSLFILMDINHMIGATAVNITDAQVRARDKFIDLIDSPRNPKVCALSTINPNTGSLNKASNPLLSRLSALAVDLTFSRRSASVASPNSSLQQVA